MSNVGSYDPTKPRSGSYSGPRRKYLSLSKKNSTIVARILPPFKSLKDKNAISFFWSIIWLVDSRGYKRQVPSIEKKYKGQVIQPDPILEKANAMKAMIENAEKNGENPHVIQQMKDRVSSLKPEKKCYLNVLTPAGEIAILKLPWTCYTLLEKQLIELREKGLDAVGVGPTSGVYFEFKTWKDEKGITQFNVAPATEHKRDPNTGLIGLSYKFAPIDQAILDRMETEAADLPNLYTVHTVEEMAQLATLDPTIITRVLMKAKEEDESDDEPEDSEPTLTGYTAPSSLTHSSLTPSVASTEVRSTPPPAAPVSAAKLQPSQLPPQIIPAALGNVTPNSMPSNMPDDVRKFLFSNSTGNGK